LAAAIRPALQLLFHETPRIRVDEFDVLRVRELYNPVYRSEAGEVFSSKPNQLLIEAVRQKPAEFLAYCHFLGNASATGGIEA
jgi:hypothetical protein